jgi:hypothetical protein
MATTKYEVAAVDGWVKVVDAADETFLVENLSTSTLLFAYGDSEPAATAPGHKLNPGSAIVRLAPGVLYVKASGSLPVTLLVSK